MRGPRKLHRLDRPDEKDIWNGEAPVMKCAAASFPFVYVLAPDHELIPFKFVSLVIAFS
jgi:hypothetical protein